MFSQVYQHSMMFIEEICCVVFRNKLIGAMNKLPNSISTCTWFDVICTVNSLSNSLHVLATLNFYLVKSLVNFNATNY